MDTASKVHAMHALLEDALPQALLSQRSGQSQVDLGVRLGCMALPEAERTPCHSTRYAIAMSPSKAFEAGAFAVARDSDMATRVPSKENMQRDEINRYAEVLKSVDPAERNSVEKQFIEAVAYKEGMKEAIAKAADVFESCTKLSMCNSEDEASGCGAALKSELCLAAGDCEPARRSCKDRCRHCAWVLRSWPAWTGACASLVNPKRKAKFSKSAGSVPKPTGDTPVEGFLSPSFEAAMRKSPRDEDELQQFCYALSWSMQDLVDAEMVVAGSGGSAGQQMLGPTPWSPALACSCLGQCPYSSTEALVLHDAGCLGPSSAREVEAWRRRTEEEAEGEGKLYRTAMAQEREASFQRDWFDSAADLLARRAEARQVALEDHGARSFQGGEEEESE
jgi:hypothetical protein